MHLFVQACILGILTGGVYALMASGLALGFGVMRVINVAQGALIILGAYLSYTLYGDLGLDPFVGLIVVAPAMLVLGIVLQLVFLRPLRDEGREGLSLLVTWAVAIVSPFNPGRHYDLLSRLLSIIVLGGLGSLGGAVVAALFMGISESVFSAEISPTWSSFTFLIVLIGVLVVRPQGLFGARVRGSI